MNKKIILITGSSKGIGLALVKYYISNGYIVYGCSRSVSEFEHENYHHAIVDVSIEQDVKSLMQKIKSDVGYLDILINNAGIASLNHILLTPTKTVEKLFNTNFLGTFIFIREAAKLLRKSQHPRIVNFSTVAVPLNLEGEAIYASAKSAVVTLTKIAAKELAPLNITINAIGPTPIDTNLIKNIPKEKIDKLIAQQSIKRLGCFEDVINVINFFIAPESNFITGQVIYLGG